DAAGTTLATAAGQPVGKVTRAAGSVDASQATALSRPTLARWPKGGRRNLLTWTEDLTDAAWGKNNVTPLATGFREIATSSAHFIEQIVSLTGDVTAAFEVQEVGRNVIRLVLGTETATY